MRLAVMGVVYLAVGKSDLVRRSLYVSPLRYLSSTCCSVVVPQQTTASTTWPTRLFSSAMANDFPLHHEHHVLRYVGGQVSNALEVAGRVQVVHRSLDDLGVLVHAGL